MIFQEETCVVVADSYPSDFYGGMLRRRGGVYDIRVATNYKDLCQRAEALEKPAVMLIEYNLEGLRDRGPRRLLDELNLICSQPFVPLFLIPDNNIRSHAIAAGAWGALSPFDAERFWDDMLLARRILRLLDNNRDPVTGDINRREATKLAIGVVATAKFSSASVWYIVMDLDNFKPINDTYGHWFGDEVLKQVHEIIRAHIKKTDILYRIGGDEFVIILPTIDREAAPRVVRQLKERLLKPLVFGDISLSVEASFGIAELPAREIRNPTDDNLKFLKMADMAMYDDKRRHHPSPKEDELSK